MKMNTWEKLMGIGQWMEGENCFLKLINYIEKRFCKIGVLPLHCIHIGISFSKENICFNLQNME